MDIIKLNARQITSISSHADELSPCYEKAFEFLEKQGK